MPVGALSKFTQAAPRSETFEVDLGSSGKIVFRAERDFARLQALKAGASRRAVDDLRNAVGTLRREGLEVNATNEQGEVDQYRLAALAQSFEMADLAIGDESGDWIGFFRLSVLNGAAFANIYQAFQQNPILNLSQMLKAEVGELASSSSPTTTSGSGSELPCASGNDSPSS